MLAVVGGGVFDLAEELKPKVRLPGSTVQEIDWNDAKLERNQYAARAFPMSRLPQLPAARREPVDESANDREREKKSAQVGIEWQIEQVE